MTDSSSKRTTYMDAFRAFKLYTSVKVHFSNDSFDLFSAKKLRGGPETFHRRKDQCVFEKWAKKYDAEDFIVLVAANCMYGNPECAYDPETARENYKEYEKRRQSITKQFSDDLDKLKSLDEQEIIQRMVGGHITIETCVILHEVLGLFNTEMPSIFETALRRIKKSKRFVRYNRRRIEAVLKERGHMKEVEA